MRLHESGEMYLETVLLLSGKMNGVRSIDVAEEMGVKKPSVSRAVGLLKQAGYLDVEENGFLRLTPSGREVAEKTYARHKVLTEFFVRLGVDPYVAATDACKVEHHISDETFEAIKAWSEATRK